MDVIGIGFLNIDSIKSMPWFSSYATQLLHQEFEPGKEETLSDENISQRIRKIGTAGFDYIGPGGSAFNTIRCIAQLDMGICVGYIGVLGEPDDGCDLKQSFLKYSIDSTWIFESTKPCGKSLSLYWPREQARSLRTASGANVDLKAQLSSPVIQEEVITYLAGAKWVHVTGLDDDASLSTVQDLIVRAKQANPRLVLSFDPGSEYCRNPTVAVREMIKIADYLLVNSTEFRQLGGYEEDQQLKGSQTKEKDIAAGVFQSFVGPQLMIVLKSYNATSFFQTYKEGVFLRRYWHTPLLPPMIRDDTGAGDVFAAGFIVSQLTPALSFDMKTALAFCSRLVKTKLRMLGCDAETEYQVALKNIFEEEKLRNEEARAFVTAAVRDGKTTMAWSDSMLRRVSSNLTGCCADFGLLDQGTKSVRKILPYRIEPTTVAILAYDLHFAGHGDNSVIHHPEWALFGLEPADVLEELKRLALRNWLIVQTAGGVVRIGWQCKTMKELIDVLTQR